MAEWLVSCNIKYYDVDGAFKKLKRLDWKQSSPSIEDEDIVYIYVSAPIRAVKYKCRVVRAGLTKRDIDDSEFILNGDRFAEHKMHMELELVRAYSDELTYSVLEENGVKGRIMAPRRVKEELHDYIVENDL